MFMRASKIPHSPEELTQEEIKSWGYSRQVMVSKPKCMLALDREIEYFSFAALWVGLCFQQTREIGTESPRAHGQYSSPL
jgi:hypothetical protein